LAQESVRLGAAAQDVVVPTPREMVCSAGAGDEVPAALAEGDVGVPSQLQPVPPPTGADAIASGLRSHHIAVAQGDDAIIAGRPPERVRPVGSDDVDELVEAEHPFVRTHVASIGPRRAPLIARRTPSFGRSRRHGVSPIDGGGVGQKRMGAGGASIVRQCGETWSQGSG
jgi:hypothetical protein